MPELRPYDDPKSNETRFPRHRVFQVATPVVQVFLVIALLALLAGAVSMVVSSARSATARYDAESGGR